LVSLKNIISHILRKHGFEVYEIDDIIYGQNDSNLVTVGIYENVTIKEIREHVSKISDKDGRHIICVLEAGDAAIEEAKRTGLVIWRRQDLEADIGQALVNRINQAEEETIFTGLFREKEHIPDSSPEPDVQPMISLEAQEMAPIIIETLGTEGQPRIVKSRLTLEDVKEISDNTIQGFKHDLELVPHYVFNYTCNYDGKDGQEIHGTGIIAINALTGKYTGWDAEPEFDTEHGHHIQMEPKIDEENAIKIAIHAVAQLNTEFKEIIVEREHATIIEKAIFRPEEGNIKLERQTLVMVPVWCVEGKYGVMILDGITGKIISEDYYDRD
jgi:hypothetical protein